MGSEVLSIRVKINLNVLDNAQIDTVMNKDCAVILAKQTAMSNEILFSLLNIYRI